MVPGAIGTQTGGSTIRPGAFCGVVGFKPTHGLIARSGALQLTRTLDHVGVFARSVEDVALLTEVLAGFDPEDPDTRPLARGPYVKVATGEPPLPPRFAFVRTAAWKHIEPVMSEAFGELVAALGERAVTVDLGSSFENTLDLHRTVMEAEMAHYLQRDYERAGGKLSPLLRGTIERGRSVPAVEYMRAVTAIATLNDTLAEVFNEYDALLTPSAPGPAPLGLETTGNSVFCTTWSYLGTPAITLPLMASEEGMPMGVQLVGRRDNDARLLRTANWLVKTLGRGGKPARQSRARKGKSQ
jgi:Asp-tRNA(Asn)/Glu-tRNA(Gln) amidotransferase A subunit family amidase